MLVVGAELSSRCSGLPNHWWAGCSGALSPGVALVGSGWMSCCVMALCAPLGDFPLINLLVVKTRCRITVSMLWEFENERRAASGGLGDADRAVVRADDGRDDGQAQSGTAARPVAAPAARRVAAVEPLEHPPGPSGVHAVAVIAGLRR